MTQIAHLGRSRIAKVITDAADSDKDFEQAAATLDAVLLVVTLDAEQAATAAGQAAVLTMVTASMKCFGKAVLVCDDDAPLKRRLDLGSTLLEVVRAVGGKVEQSIPPDATHVVTIGQRDVDNAFAQCWWSGWNAGVLPPWDDERCGNSDNPLAGVFAGGLAVREVFANAIGRRRSVNHRVATSLWTPWQRPDGGDTPPSKLALPGKLWFVGLGHLGQGFLWSLAFLPVSGHAILQDDQTVGEENVATGLVTRRSDFEIKKQKTRVAARWLEGAGWKTSLIERRNHGDLQLTPDDPPVILTSIDEPNARIAIAKAGQEFLIDAGVGHGAIDFEIGQIRVVPKGVDPETLWSRPARTKNVDAMLQKPAYREHARDHDNCGTFSLAEASVAVPFVGATVGALTIAQLLRLAALKSTAQIIQIELGMPEATSAGILNPTPTAGFGGIEFSFA